MNNDDQPATKRDLELALQNFATKRDLEHAIHELRQFIVEREIITLRWMMGLQITYFFGTLAAVWFMLAHYKP